ncbi:hypothetical protein C731_3938 [Mycolicibacterium hassiacum DSM 44199]|uniref:Uncharacterized protein n=1 Tax=Mycolicibacterium hassiacum (strain DSM 44199 / CIP 105218 / JCM 12690 / 3849) TaxID=1122247 RepID=K5BE73_MYCHD|nr:hypothetical protein C731_3938 [Mycolicibacterium hassiacum DSM 44199]
MVEHPGFFLSQDDDPAGAVGESLKHRWLPALHHIGRCRTPASALHLPSTLMGGSPGCPAWRSAVSGQPGNRPCKFRPAGGYPRLPIGNARARRFVSHR